MESMRSQPDLHDLLYVEDDALSPIGGVSPERNVQHSLNGSSNKINTPAKVLMVGEPVLVKTEQPEDSHEDGVADVTTSIAEISGSSTEELADGINTPSPETAAAMESLIEDDDLTSASPKLDVSQKPSVPVNFTAVNTNRIIVKPQTSIMASAKGNQPISIAGKKFMVATQPVQVIKRESGGGPVVTKFIVKRTSTATAASQKSPIVFTKAKGLLASPSRTFKSGSILLSPIKGGFKIPISPIKSPIKVSVIPPSNSKRLPMLGKPITVPIHTSVPQLQRKPPVKFESSANAITMVNGVLEQTSKGFANQQHITIQNRPVSANSIQSQASNRQGQVMQQLNILPSAATLQDSQGNIQYLQLIPPSNNAQQPTLRSNQGQPITFTSMAQLNGGNLSLNQSGGTIAFLPPNLPKLQSSNTQRYAQTVKVAIPSPSTHQIKPQRLIMPATSIHQGRSNVTTLASSSVLPGGNIGYAMVPAKYVEQLTQHLSTQNSFNPENSYHPTPKPLVGKIGANGKLKKPCNCTKSQCLKLYCECFANGQFCDECNCVNCFNNLEHETDRSKAVKQCLERNPAAFRPKIGRGKDDHRTHQKGCNCKRSGCLKNYCECYEARIPCTSKCKCIGCKNYEETGDRRSLMSLADAAEVRVQQQTAAKTKLSNQIGEIRPTARTTLTGERLPYTFFTQEVIEATCTCLLAQAEEAEKTKRPMAVAEAMILEEFGRCVMQIIQSAGKAKVLPYH